MRRRLCLSVARSLFVFFMAVLMAVGMISSAVAQSSQSRITQAINESNLVRLARNTRPEANYANDRGSLPDGYNVEHILFFLQRSPQQEQELEVLIDSLNNRNSPNFHHWLTAEEFGERFGVAQEDIDTVTGWLESHGFRINQVYPSHMLIDISGSAGQIREAFHTEIHNLEVGGVSHLSNMSDPMIPAALAPVVKGPFSLNDFKPEPMYRVRPDYTFAGCASSTAGPSEPGTCYAMTPQDNQTIYNLNPLYAAGYSGQGQTIVLVEDTDTYGTAGSNGASDWNTYRSTFGFSTAFPLGSYSQVHPGGCADPGTNGDDGEAAIDVEVASAIAPSAAIELISCPSATFTFGGLIALQNMINASGPYPGVVSVSYGLCEAFTGQGGNAGFYNTYQQAAAQGISVFASSGDEGPSSCSNLFGTTGEQYDVATLGVTGWGETPYNVSVGGTDFEDVYNFKTGQNGGAALSTYWSSTNTSGYGSALSYIPEMPWDDSCANVLISEVATGSFIPYGASPATCNNATFDVSTSYLSTGAASGGASNCATGAGGSNQGGSGDTLPQCQGYAKPSYQSGSSLAGGQAVYGQPSDGVRDVPDVSMFAANGVWGHFETVCWSDPAQTSGGSVSCSGAPSTWAGFGGTSVASPTMAAIQALVNQKTGESWGNPDPIYYQIAQNQYGTAGGTFLGSGCNSNTGNPSACAFNDVTQGDIDLACEDNGTTTESHCYKPTGTHGVDSTDVVTAATVINGGTGYTTAPTCAIAGPSNSNPYKSPTGTTLWAGGTQATCTAAVNSASTTAVWTVKIGTTGTNLAVGAAGAPITVGGTTYTFVTALTAANQVLVVTSGTTSTQETAAAKNLEAAINANSAQCVTAPCFGTGTVANASATAAETTSTVTITAKTAGYAGNFNVVWGSGSGYIEGADIITITNTTLGQGPNYVSGITITNGGSGYQPDTPITLTGAGNGAIAVANTSIGTAAQSYQPAWGAAPGYDLATGLGTPNAYSLVCSTVWGSGCSSFTLSANPTSVTSTQGGAAGTSTITVNPLSGFAGSVTLSATGLPTGVTAGFGTNPTTGTSLLTLTAAANAVPGTSTVTINGVSGSLNASTTVSLTVAGAPGIYSPVAGSTFASNAATFSWNAYPGATAYWLDLGASQGANTYLDSGSLSSSTLSYSVTSLPTNGTTVWARWYYFINGGWSFIDYSYIAYGGLPNGDTTATITSPAPGTLAGSSVTFNWSVGVGPTAYDLDIGNVAGGNQYYTSGSTTALTAVVNGLPTDGSTVYVTLYSLIGGVWYSNPYTYTAFNPSAGAAVMQTPLPGSTLTSSSVTFMWNAGTNATAYWLDLGTGPGGNQIYQSGNLGTALSVNVSGLPTDGSPIYATLYSFINGSWVSNAYMYTAFTASSGKGAMQSPTPGSTFTGSTVTFNWTAGSSATAYWLDIGNVAGGNQYSQSGNLGNVLTTTVNGLPTDGSTVYVTLYSYVGGQWLSTGYIYTAFNPTGNLGVIQTPTPGSVLSGSTQTFTWSAGSSATAYWLDIGNIAGGNQYYQSGNLGNVNNTTVNSLPADGSTIYATLYSFVGGQWLSTSATYVSGP